MMDRNNFMSRIRITQIVDYHKLLLIQRKVEKVNKTTVEELLTIINKLSEKEKQELEKMYIEQIQKLENEIKRKSTSKK